MIRNRRVNNTDVKQFNESLIKNIIYIIIVIMFANQEYDFECLVSGR